MGSDKEKRPPEGSEEPDELGLPTWTEGILPPRSSDVADWEDVIPDLRERGEADEADYKAEEDFEIVGGEDFPPHEHRFTGERCEVCGAVRRYRPRAA